MKKDRFNEIFELLPGYLPHEIREAIEALGEEADIAEIERWIKIQRSKMENEDDEPKRGPYSRTGPK